MELNTRYLKISGKVELDEEMRLGQDKQILVTIVGIDHNDNQDGTYDEVYKGKLFEILD